MSSVPPLLAAQICSEGGSDEERISEAAMASPSVSASTSQQSEPSENGDPRTRLEQLKSHPFFGDLQVTLALECLQHSTVPYSLLSDSSTSSKLKTHPAFCTVSDNIIEQHRNLQNTLVGMQMYFPNLLGSYHQLVEQVESHRYKALTYNCHSENLKRLINWFYDSERRVLVEKMQEYVTALMNKTKNLLPEPSALNFGFASNLLPFSLAAKTSLAAPTDSAEIEVPLDLSGSPNKLFVKTQPPEKKSRFLSKKAVSILQQWYQNHRDHPYATDEEVKKLATRGAITPNQVKKWMANTRARSFNTLTYNGGKRMLNSKIVVKKRLLHKYKRHPSSASGSGAFFDGRFSQRRENAEPTPIPVDENCEEESIDVETVSSGQTSDVTDSSSNINGAYIFNKATVDSEAEQKGENAQPPSVPKPSLEQVVARCRLKSSEPSGEGVDNVQSQKSAIESLRDVVNNVSAINNHPDDTEQLPVSTAQQGSHSPPGVKRYLSAQAKTILSEWFRKHLYRPYPTFEEKRELAALCGISSSKVDTWFANKRNRTRNTNKFPPKYSHLL